MATVAGAQLQTAKPIQVQPGELGQMLTVAELDIAKLAMKNYTAQEIATELGLDIGYVRKVRRSPMFKQSQAEIAEAAFEHIDRIRERLEALAENAVDIVDQILVSEEETAKVKLDAARMVFDTVGVRKAVEGVSKVAVINQIVNVTDVKSATAKIANLIEGM